MRRGSERLDEQDERDDGDDADHDGQRVGLDDAGLHAAQTAGGAADREGAEPRRRAPSTTFLSNGANTRRAPSTVPRTNVAL